MFCQLVVLFCLCVVWRLWLKKRSACEPPKLSRKLPIIGHAHKIMGDGVHMFKFMRSSSEECARKGGLVTVYLGPRKTYFTDPEDSLTITNTCLQKHSFFDFAKPLLGNGLITADVPTWKRHRKLLNPAFSQPVLNSFIEIFNDQAKTLVERFANELGEPIDHEHLLRKTNLETICMTAFGVDATDDGDLHKEYLPRFSTLLENVNLRVQKIWLQSDFIFNMTKEKKIMDMEKKKLLALSQSIIERKKLDRKNLVNKENKDGKVQTFIDLILDLANDTGCFTDEQIREETDNIIAGGHDTTASLLTFAFTVLGSHPEVQRKAYEEILHVLGKAKNYVDKDDLSKLLYVEAVLKETMRLYPIVFVLPRHIDRDVKLRNYTMKSNSECFISLYGLHRHSIWGSDAEQFRPERWLDKETLPDLKYFGAFGLGRRACIGRGYAMMSMKIILAHMLRKYYISSDISKMVISMHVLPRPASGHHITLALRNVSSRA